MKRIILYPSLIILASVLAWVTVSYPMERIQEGFMFGGLKTIAPESKFTRIQIQEFKIRVMNQQYYKSGLMDKEEWYEKLDKHCKGQGIYPTLCSYCECIVRIQKGDCGISHGICPSDPCIQKAYYENDLLPDPEMIDAQKEFNEKGRLYEVYLKRS